MVLAFKDIEVIIWDMDGTLYRNTPGMWDGFLVEIVRKASEQLNVSSDEFAAALHDRYLELGSHTQVLDELGVDGRGLINEVIQQKLPSLIGRDERLVKMFAGLKKYRHVIVTNADLESTEIKLGVLGLDLAVFERVFATFEMEFMKPDVRVYEEVLSWLGVDAGKCLVVGDRVETDLVPAKRLGMRTCLVCGESGEVDVCLESVYQIGEMLGREEG
jgi:FMN phosphatase YigB (HAD superfamily)